MDESESKNEKPKEERRFSQEQYDMLKRCSDKKDMTEWNEWRKEYDYEDILLEGAEFSGCYLKGINLSTSREYDRKTPEVFLSRAKFNRSDLENVNFQFANLERTEFHQAILEGAGMQFAHLRKALLLDAHLEGAKLRAANLTGANLGNAHLEGADICDTNLEGANLNNTHLQGAQFRLAMVSGSTSLCYCYVDCSTDFREVGFGNARIDPGTKQLLEYNNLRMNWDDWYKKGYWWQRILKRIFIWPFWLMSDYGRSTGWIIFTFFGLAFLFALVYRFCPSCVIVMGEVGDIRGFWHALYFSVVTMTTLGFGDIAANPDSWGGQTLLMLQVILGYVLLGALVTRFAVLFTAGGPAGKFADEKGEKDETE